MKNKVIILVRSIVLIVAFLFLLTACGTTERLSTPVSSANSITATESDPRLIKLTPTPTGTIEVPTIDEGIETNKFLKEIVSDQNIPVGSQRLVWWSPDAKSAFYRDVTDVWQYILDTEQRSLAMNETVLTPTPPGNLQAYIPVDAVQWSISPSGDLALYLVPLESNTPTLPSTSIPLTQLPGGEIWQDRGNVELWLLSNTGSQKLGEIDWCIGEFIWSHDEQIVVLDDIEPPAVCTQSDAWLIDLKSQEIQALFPKERYPNEVTVGELSPEGDRLIYQLEGIWNIIDLQTANHTRLEIPRSAYIQWLDQNTLFVAFRDEDSKTWKLGTYKLDKSELEEWVSFDDVQDFTGLSVIETIVSPDQKWVAFAVGKDRYIASSIWIMSITEHQ